jgi:hypothetical protein
MAAVDPLNPPTLPEWRARVQVEECKWDGASLAGRPLDAYPHEGGWYTQDHEGKVHKLWLSIRCPKCGYDWSLNKLGVPRG